MAIYGNAAVMTTSQINAT